MRGLFRGAGWTGGAVQLEAEVLDFGQNSRLRAGEAKSIRVINHTAGKLAATWVVPGGKKGQPAPCFVVSPPTADLLPHSAAVLTVRWAGSQIVAFIDVPFARGEGAVGPQIGAFGPNSILPGVGVHLSSLHPKWGIGPRVEPSHSSQPMAQPFENQKHA